ncbi:MAG: magnesium chelatase subunit D [Pseudomonadota bacterium]
MRDTAEPGWPPSEPAREPAAGAARWADAALAATLLAVDPEGLGGAALRARPGPARDAWLSAFEALAGPLRRVPPGISEDRLEGGLDLAETLAAGRPVRRRGVLEEDGHLLLPMAERMEPGTAARIAAAQEARALCLIALDEGAEPDERAPRALSDRLAFAPDLEGLARSDLDPPPVDADAVLAARAALPDVDFAPDLPEALTALAAALGIGSLRAPLLALRAARAAAALAGDAVAGQEAAEIAARLVLAPRATRLPPGPEAEAETTPPPPEPPAEADAEDATPPAEAPIPQDVLLEAARAALPPGLLAALTAGRAPGASRDTGGGAELKTTARGRPLATRRGLPRAGARLDLVETLRAAAPWQPLRRAAGETRVAVRADDFRIRRFRRRGESLIVFVVDASGSAAMARLAEAKGAVELMLAEAYVRREEVALIAFRGTEAELVLPPTRALVAAKRALAGLPGGGGTPLAAGLAAGLALADRASRQGVTPYLAVLTDGRANIARDGTPGRTEAAEDARTAARALRAAGHRTVWLDTGARPSAAAEALAREGGATYLPLPRADAHALSATLRAHVGADA